MESGKNGKGEAEREIAVGARNRAAVQEMGKGGHCGIRIDRT